MGYFKTTTVVVVYSCLNLCLIAYMIFLVVDRPSTQVYLKSTVQYLFYVKLLCPTLVKATILRGHLGRLVRASTLVGVTTSCSIRLQKVLYSREFYRASGFQSVPGI